MFRPAIRKRAVVATGLQPWTTVYMVILRHTQTAETAPIAFMSTETNLRRTGIPASVPGAVLTALAVGYLIAGTGIFSDDFALIFSLAQLSPAEMVWPAAGSIATPLTHLTHAWFYYLIQDRQPLFYDGLKAVYLLLSLYMVWRFFSLWFGQHKSVIVAALFVFYPIHDAVTYWFIGQYLLLSFALLAYSFYLLQGGRTPAALATGLLGSFISYGSSAVALGLALIFVLRRDFRRAALMLAPNLIYATYYLTLTMWLEKGVARVPAGVDAGGVAKQFLLQLATFADAAAGPSFWLKMALAFGEISAGSVLVAAAVVFMLARLPGGHTPERAPRELVWGGFGVATAAFGMFAVTGFYPQLAFNLGDRVTIFGNFLVVAVLAALPLSRRQWLALVAVYALAIFGVSDHWKAWQVQQQAVMRQIGANPALRTIGPGNVLYVTGHQYSRYGPISHIEFFSESFVAQSVFALALREAPAYPVFSLNQRYQFDGMLLVDRKYGVSRPVGAGILVYDSAVDHLQEVPAAAINEYLGRLPAERRTWIQFLGDGPVRRAIVYLMPRLQYAF